MEYRIKTLAKKLLCDIIEGNDLDGAQQLYLENLFLHNEGASQLLEDFEGLKLFTLGRRLLADRRYPTKPLVVGGNFYITPRGRVFARKKQLPKKLLLPVEPLMSFDSFKGMLVSNGTDLSKVGRLFPRFSDNFYPSEGSRCAWCYAKFPVSKEYEDVDWNDLKPGFRRPPNGDFTFHDDHFEMIPVSHFFRRLRRMVPTFSDLRTYVLGVADAGLRSPNVHTIYPFVAKKDDADTLWSYLMKSSLVTNEYPLSSQDVFLVRVTYPVHWRCLHESLTAPERWKTEEFWEAITMMTAKDPLSLRFEEKN